MNQDVDVHMLHALEAGMGTDDRMTAEEVLEAFRYGPGLEERIRRSTLRKWAREGTLQGQATDGELTYDRAEVEALLDEWDSVTGRLQERGTRALQKEARIQAMLDLMGEDPSCTKQAMADAIGATRITVYKYVRELVGSGKVRITATGQWEVVEDGSAAGADS